MSKLMAAAVGLVIGVVGWGAAYAASGDTVKAAPAQAEENRRKPLQRCDELADKAQLDCLEQARQRVVEARAKREAASAKGTAAHTSGKPGAGTRDGAAQGK